MSSVNQAAEHAPASTRPTDGCSVVEVPLDSDEELIAQVAQRGDLALAENSFWRLHQQYRMMVTRFIGARIDASQVDDLAQETWIRIWNRAETFQSGSFRSWMLTIANNQVRDRHRKLGRRGETSLEEQTLGEVEQTTQADANLIDEEERNALARCLERLAERDRDVVRQRMIGTNYDQIAQRLELSEGNARKIWHRAKAALTKCVGQQPSL